MSPASTESLLSVIAEPFPGLRSFESDEEPIFRGRQQHTDELLRRLAEHRFLVVMGTSGSGKSSLVRAGLLPALDRGYLVGTTSRWRIAVMRPGMAPIGNLTQALCGQQVQEASLKNADEATLRSSSLGLVQVVRDAKLEAGESLLVVVDQFEELFRYQRVTSALDRGDAAAFVDLLLTAVRRPDAPIYVVLTMRSDFLGDCAQFPGLPEAMSESQYLIPRLTREQRRQAIEEPLRLFGATITPQLVEQLLNDSGGEVNARREGADYRGGEADSLPILQHALLRTYLTWKSLPKADPAEPIDISQYEDAGRMEQALEKHAERLFGELDEANRLWVERIFRCLTTTELGRPVRRPTSLAQLYKVIGAREEDRASVDGVLALLARRENSFIQVAKDNTVDISHESLIWKWNRLGDWVTDEAAGAELYRDLLKDAESKTTWGNPKLSSALSVRRRAVWNEYWGKQYSKSEFSKVDVFLLRSQKAVRSQKWFRWLALAWPVLLLAVVAVGYVITLRERDQRFRAIAALNAEASNLLSTQNEFAERIAVLDSQKGTTVEDRQRIADERYLLMQRVAESAETSKILAQKAEQSHDQLLVNVQALQDRLLSTQKALDDETRKHADAEAKLSELTGKGNQPSRGAENSGNPRAIVLLTEEAKAAAAKAAADLINRQNKDAADRALARSKTYMLAGDVINAYESLADLNDAQRLLVKSDMAAIQDNYARSAMKKARELQTAHTPIHGLTDEDALLAAYTYLQRAGRLNDDPDIGVRLDKVGDEISRYYQNIGDRYLQRPLSSGLALGWSYLMEADHYQPNKTSIRDDMNRHYADYQMRGKISIEVVFHDQTSRRDSAGFADQLRQAASSGIDTLGAPVKVVSGNANTVGVFQLMGEIIDHRSVHNLKKETLQSKYRSGSREIPNTEWNKADQDYETINFEVAKWQRELASAEAKSSGKGIKEANKNLARLRGVLLQARAKMNSIPRTVTEDVVSSYNYTRNTLELTSIVELSFRIVDPTGSAIGEPFHTGKGEKPKKFIYLEDVKPDDTQGLKDVNFVPDEVQLMTDAEIEARDSLVKAVQERVRALPLSVLSSARAAVASRDLDGAGEFYVRYLNSTAATDTPERQEAIHFLTTNFNLRHAGELSASVR